MDTNDHLSLTPITAFNGPALTFDFPEVKIGVAEYAEGPTGCTVFHFTKPALTATDIRGGSPGTFGNFGTNDAICFAGGSLYGLEACAGVMAEIFAQEDYSTDFEKIAAVSGAIIYDYPARKNAIYPDKALGRAATKAAQPGAFPLGARGAGRSAGCGWHESEPAGQGGAFRQIGPIKLAVFTVVNSSGVIVDRYGRVVRGNIDPKTGQRCSYVDVIEADLAKREPKLGNTTLTLVLTNQKLPSHALTQLGRQVHTSMARAIQPFHGPYDGDVLYAATINDVENDALDAFTLGVVASELAWDAVLSAVSTNESG